MKYWIQQCKSRFKLWLSVVLGINPYALRPYGKCPVQMDGKLSDGKFFYFRSRGTNVSLGIGDTENGAIDDTVFYRYMFYGTDYEAGYLPSEDAIRIATLWINEYFILKQ